MNYFDTKSLELQLQKLIKVSLAKHRHFEKHVKHPDIVIYLLKYSVNADD